MKKFLRIFVAAVLALGAPIAGIHPASSAINSIASTVQYTGNGTTTAFSFPYAFFQYTDLVPTLFNTSTNLPVTPAPVYNGGGTYDYTVLGVTAFSNTNNVTEYASATITFNNAPPSNYTIILTRAVPATQNLNLLDNEKFLSSSVNTQLDRLTILAQQNAALLGNVLQFPASDPAGLNYVLPPVAARANFILAFDSMGQPIVSTTTLANIIAGATNAAASATAAASSASTASSSATAAAASATAAAASAQGLIDTSTSSVAIGTGTKTFTVSAGKSFQAGQFILITDQANSANYMHGQVTSYSGTSLVTSISDTGGSGTKTAWNISISGSQGSAGSSGVSGTGSWTSGDMAEIDSSGSSGYTVSDSGIVASALAPLASPALTGAPTAPTQTSSDNSTKIATDAFVKTAISGVTSPILPPQGRLTPTTGVPVIVADAVVQGTLYYDCYLGNKVPYYNGSADASDTISSCEVSDAMAASSTGVINSAQVVDVWWEGNTNHNICLATSSGGNGWASDTGGSNTARGTGYSQLDKTTRPYITNKNQISYCWNGTSNYAATPIAANKLTYLGTIYTTAAGKTGVSLYPTAASGGTNNIIGIFNAYNRVRASAFEQDSTTSWIYSSISWRGENNSTSNRISWIDGLKVVMVQVRYNTLANMADTSGSTSNGVDFNSASATPAGKQGNISIGGALGENETGELVAMNITYPLLGFNYVQAMESGNTNGANFVGAPASALQWDGEF